MKSATKLVRFVERAKCQNDVQCIKNEEGDNLLAATVQTEQT